MSDYRASLPTVCFTGVTFDQCSCPWAAEHQVLYSVLPPCLILILVLPAAFSKPHLQEQWQLTLLSVLGFFVLFYCLWLGLEVFFVWLFVVLIVQPLWLQWKVWMSEGKCPRDTTLEKQGKTNQNLLCVKISNSNILDLGFGGLISHPWMVRVENEEGGSTCTGWCVEKYVCVYFPLWWF